MNAFRLTTSRHCWLTSNLIPHGIIVALSLCLFCQLGCNTPKLQARPTIGQLVNETMLVSEEARLNVESHTLPTVSDDPLAAYKQRPAGVRILPDATSTMEQPNPILEANLRTAPLSGDFIETPLRDALNDLCAEANVQLILDDNVQGVVNLTFTEKPIDEAFKLILSAQPSYHRRVGDTIYVTTADPKSPLFPIVAQRLEYRPRFIEAKALLESVPQNHREFVSHIEGLNILLIEAPERIASRIVQRFDTIDKPTPQVGLEAIVCVIAPDSGQRLGLDWSHAVELDGKQAFKFGVTGLGLGVDVSNQGVDAMFSDFSKTSAFVNALCEYGYLTIRAAPHVVAQDGEKASIVINRETFFSIQPPAAAGADRSAFFFQQNIERVESGITFDITPKVRGDVVTVEIEKAEVSEDIRTANAEAALNPFPIINRRSVSTTVSVKDGRTIVLGGLMQRETVERENKIPILGDLPVVGRLFKSVQRQSRDVEVVIFLSPRIIPPDLLTTGLNLQSM